MSDLAPDPPAKDGDPTDGESPPLAQTKESAHPSQEAVGEDPSQQQETLERLISSERQRRTASEARDLIGVIRQLAAGSRQGMAVERDAHIHGDLIMQVGLEKAADAGRSYTHSDRISYVDAEDIQRVRYVYQRPLAYHRGLGRLQARHLVLLLGQANVGKRAAAIQLALDVMGDDLPQILEYGRGVSLENLAPSVWQPNSAYLVDRLLVERVRNLSRQTLQAVADTLKQAGSYLILCADPDAVPEDDVVRAFAVRLEPPPISASILLERHLSYYGQEEFGADEIQSLLERPEIQPVLRRPLSPQGADDLSQRLLRALRGEIDIEEAIKGYGAAVERQVEAWFEEAGDDIEERAFRLALAALNGARYMAVQEAANDLAERLTPPAPPPDPDKPPLPPPSPFARRLGRRLEKAQAHLEWVPEPGSSLPGSRIEVVRLDDDAYPAALLRYVWCEYDNLRQELLNWLSDYATSKGRTGEVRTRAAAAIGALASYDVATIRDRVLIPWALEEDRLYRAAIGKALSVLIWDDARAADVLALLKDWSQRSERVFRWAAARAYGDVGLRYPRRAIQQWRQILLSAEYDVEVHLTDDWRLVLYNPLPMSILDTMLNFFLAAVEMPSRYRDVYEGAVQALKDWCDEDHQEKRERHGTAMGLPIFMILASILVEDANVESDPDTWPPAMLVLVSDSPSPSPYRATLAELFRRALNWRPTHAQALTIMESWLCRVDHDTRLEGSVVALLREIISGKEADDRDRGRMAAYLRRWATHPHHPIQTAGRARQQLKL